MIYRKKILLLLFILPVFVSCTEIIEIELDSTYSRLVVSGTVTTDSIRHKVKLTTTTDYFYNEPPPAVENATVSISFDDTIVFLEESVNQPGVHLFPDAFRGVEGTTYYLEIRDVDIDKDGISELYEAETTMPDIAMADSIRLQKFITPFFSGYQVALWSPEPTGLHYYNYKLLRNGILINRRLSDYTVQTDEFINNNYISGIPVGFLNDEDENEVVNPGDEVTLEINSLTEDYYSFIVDAQSEIFGNNPLFSGPPANVHSNISNGAVGIFTAYSIDRVSVVASIPAF
ncbi:MAG: DUF4249 family protein [Bacteroidales bacterium]